MVCCVIMVFSNQQPPPASDRGPIWSELAGEVGPVRSGPELPQLSPVRSGPSCQRPWSGPVHGPWSGPCRSLCRGSSEMAGRDITLLEHLYDFDCDRVPT